RRAAGEACSVVPSTVVNTVWPGCVDAVRLWTATETRLPGCDGLRRSRLFGHFRGKNKLEAGPRRSLAGACARNGTGRSRDLRASRPVPLPRTPKTHSISHSSGSPWLRLGEHVRHLAAEPALSTSRTTATNATSLTIFVARNGGKSRD